MSIRKSSSKSIISDISARLQKLEVERAIGADHNYHNYDPELAEIQARYAEYKEEKAEKWKRLGREPTYHESWAELTFSQYLHCARGQGTPEERYQFRRAHRYTHDSYIQGSFKGCNPLTGCIPECRYYADKGRIEDDEAIADFERGKEKIHPLCPLSVRLSSGCDECSKNSDSGSRGKCISIEGINGSEK